MTIAPGQLSLTYYRDCRLEVIMAAKYACGQLLMVTNAHNIYGCTPFLPAAVLRVLRFRPGSSSTNQGACARSVLEISREMV